MRIQIAIVVSLLSVSATNTVVDCPLYASLTNNYTLTCNFSRDTIDTINVLSTITADDIFGCYPQRWDVTNCANVCEWDSVTFQCNNASRLVKIDSHEDYIWCSLPILPMNYSWPSEITYMDWQLALFAGSFWWKQLPPKLEYLNLFDNLYLTGSIHFGDLPRTLTYFRTELTSFSGTLDWTNVPPNLVTLNMEESALEGSVDLQSLPSSLEIFYLDWNNFSGSLNFTGLHQRCPNLTRVELHQNNFNGIIDWSGFQPFDLYRLDLGSNAFSGSVDFAAMAPITTSHSIVIYLWDNDFSGTVNGMHLLPANVQLHLDTDVVCNSDIYCLPNQTSTTRQSSYCQNGGCNDTCQCKGTNAPTTVPTVAPTSAPTNYPTLSPIVLPSAHPSHWPTNIPTVSPIVVPSFAPTSAPTNTPTELWVGIIVELQTTILTTANDSVYSQIIDLITTEVNSDCSVQSIAQSQSHISVVNHSVTIALNYSVSIEGSDEDDDDDIQTIIDRYNQCLNSKVNQTTVQLLIIDNNIDTTNGIYVGSVNTVITNPENDDIDDDGSSDNHSQMWIFGVAIIVILALVTVIIIICIVWRKKTAKLTRQIKALELGSIGSASPVSDLPLAPPNQTQPAEPGAQPSNIETEESTAVVAMHLSEIVRHSTTAGAQLKETIGATSKDDSNDTQSKQSIDVTTKGDSNDTQSKQSIDVATKGDSKDTQSKQNIGVTRSDQRSIVSQNRIRNNNDSDSNSEDLYNDAPTEETTTTTTAKE